MAIMESARLARWVLMSAFALGAAPPAQAAPVAPMTDYTIESGMLGDSLLIWATQSRVQIVFGPDLVAPYKAPALRGAYTPGDALEILLRGTGIEAESIGASSWILKRPVKPPRSIAPKAVQASLEAESPVRQLGAISVYSRPLLRIAAESSMPVTTITRDEIEASGYLTLFDLLRAQPGVQVTSQPEQMGGSSGATFTTGATGAASVALRSLGAKATLLLVDGRRMTNYGLAADATGSVADIGTIPLAMVERIDILREGAATLYGADAMAGVIDISLRKDFDGGEAGFVLGTSSRGDATHRQVSATFGKRLDNGASSVFMFDLVDRDPLLGDRRDWYSLDRRNDGLRDDRSEYSFPGNRLITDATGIRSLVARDGCRIEDLDDDGVCRDDRAKATSLKAGRKSASARGYVQGSLFTGIEAYADVRLTQTRQSQQSAPTRATILIPDDRNPALSQQVQYAFWDVGPVKQSTVSSLSRIDLGIAGNHLDWNWDAGVDAELSQVEDDISGLVNRIGFEQVASLYGYRFDQRPAPREIIDLLAPVVSNEGRSQSAGVRATASRDFSVWSGRTVHINLGFESRRESVRLRPDASLVSGELLIEEPVSPFDAKRWNSALYAHLDLPLVANVNADIGLRLEHAEQHGDFAAPALGLRWTPTESILLRAGAAKGRRVPTLLEQRGLDASAFSSGYEYIEVPLSLLPCALSNTAEPTRCLLELRPQIGPALRAEHSRSMHAGMIWEPSRAFSIGIDLYQLRRDDEIGLIPLGYALQNASLFPDFLSRDAEGRLDALNIYRVNLGRTTTRGIDANLDWNIETANHGNFAFQLGVNHIGKLGMRASPASASLDRAGHADHPKWTASTSVRWMHADWAATVGLNHVGNYAYSDYADDALACPAYRQAVGKCSTPGFTLVNFNITQSRWAPWRLMFNVANVFDHMPRYYRESAGGYNPLFDDPVGRYFSIGATRSF